MTLPPSLLLGIIVLVIGLLAFRKGKTSSAAAELNHSRRACLEAEERFASAQKVGNAAERKDPGDCGFVDGEPDGEDVRTP